MPPGDYFIEHLPLIRKIIHHFLIKTGDYPVDQMDELIQRVHELLLLREQNILGLFKGKAKFSTYLTVVVLNLCREIRNSEYRHRSRFIPFSNILGFSKNPKCLDKFTGSEISSSRKLLIGEAVDRLNTILQTYYTERPKIEFCLKAIYHMPLSIDDLKQYSLNAHQIMEISQAINALNDFDNCKTKTIVFKFLTSVFGIIELKNNSCDAIRKWTDDRTDELISLLNGDPQEYSFNRETFQYLFDYYCRNGFCIVQNQHNIQSNVLRQ